MIRTHSRMAFIAVATALFFVWLPIKVYAGSASESEHYYDWKQNDPRWSSITIGSKTMGENGSAVTSLAMLLVKSGFKNESDFNPGTFANDLKSVGAFNGDEFDWNAPTKIVPQFKYCGETTAQYNGGYGWESLAEYYDEGYYMLVSPNNVHWMAVSSASTRYIGSTARFSDAYVYDPSGNVSWLDGERFYTLRVKLFSAPNVTGIVQSGSYSSEGDEMEFVLYESGLLEISGNGNMCGYIYRDTPPWQKNKNLISSVRISGNITNIGGGAFDGCSNLTSITIPNSVTSIGSEAFNICNNLTDVNYKGSAEEWEKISIGNNNAPLTGADIHYNWEIVQSGKCGDSITYKLYENGLLELNGSGAMYDYSHVYSPLEQRSDITSVVIVFHYIGASPVALVAVLEMIPIDGRLEMKQARLVFTLQGRIDLCGVLILLVGLPFGSSVERARAPSFVRDACVPADRQLFVVHLSLVESFQTTIVGVERSCFRSVEPVAALVAGA